MIAQFKTLITFAIELTIDATLATVWICNFEILFSLKIFSWALIHLPQPTIMATAKHTFQNQIYLF